MGLFSFFFKKVPHAEASKPWPEITARMEEHGFVDLSLVIGSDELLADGSRLLQAYGLHKEREVGIGVVLGTVWKEGSFADMTTYQGALTYRSLGKRSDALLEVMDELYGTDIRPGKMVEERAFTAISLEGEPEHPGRGPVRIKLFHEPVVELDDEEAAQEAYEREYAELFTNLDLANATLEIHEKDEGYRVAVIRALTDGGDAPGPVR